MPLPLPLKELLRRIEAKTVKTESCWLWQGYIQHGNGPLLSIRIQGKQVRISVRRQSSPQHPGSSSLLVIQVHGSKIATSEERGTDWRILVNQGRNACALCDALSRHLVFTKNADGPQCCDAVCIGCSTS
jgi:hypothetical protein